MIDFLTNLPMVKINEHTIMSQKYENGVPLVSPSSIFLFQTAINNLPKRIVNDPMKNVILSNNPHIYPRGKISQQ